MTDASKEIEIIEKEIDKEYEKYVKTYTKNTALFWTFIALFIILSAVLLTFLTVWGPEAGLWPFTKELGKEPCSCGEGTICQGLVENLLTNSS